MEVRSTEVRPTPPAARAVKSLRQPAFWLVVGLLVVGAVRVVQLLDEPFAQYPIATMTAIALFGLYAVPFWIFVIALDYLEREPPLLLATAFAWGALVTTANAIPGSTALQDILAKLVSPQFAADWAPAVAGSSIEEILKTLGVVAIVLIARRQVNSVLDGVVYGALVGLGFQVVEDVVYAVSAVALAGQGDQVGPVVTTFFLRGFLAGLWSHTLFSALAGAGIGYFVVRTDRPLGPRLGMAAAGLLAGWFCHFLWNSPLFADGLGYTAWEVLAGLVLKGVPPLVMILVVVRAARHREGDYYAAQLAALDDQRVATARELQALSKGSLRVQARRHAYRAAGSRGRRAVRRLQRAQAGLAVALSRVTDAAAIQATCADSASPSSPIPDRPAGRVTDGSVAPRAGAGQERRSRELAEVIRWRNAVLEQRRRLEAAGHPEGFAPDTSHGVARLWLSRFAGLGLGASAVAAVWTAIRALGGG